MKNLGIAIIGYGGVARVHGMAYRAIPFHYGLPAGLVKIVGVADVNPKSAEAAARELDCGVWTTDYRELLARTDVDVIDICVPNHLHEEIILAAAAAGKHVYCEKPLANNVAQGKRIVEAVEKAGIKNQLNFNFRYYPAVTRARQMITDGFLGRVFSYRGCFYRSSYINPNKPLSWRLSKDIAGGGALFDLGSHIIDLIYYLMGDFVSVQATVETLIKERPIAPGSTEKAPVEVDDIVLMQVRMADNTLGSIEISRMGTGVTNDMKFEIFGQTGALRFSAEDPSWLEVFDVKDSDQPTGGMSGFRKIQAVSRFEGHKAPDWSMAPGFSTTFVESQYRFLQAVSDDLQPSPTFKDALHIQQVMQAAFLSSSEHRWVSIAETLK
ncbi:MAG: Gfo/Idh/MocA family protein [Anaerolineaceae bacterium]